MCGISGYINKNTSPIPLDLLGGMMSDSLRHRGPDSSGVWLDERCGLVLSHRRLSIRDRSDAGSQPMVSADGRYVIVYNGEVYNSDELKNELLACGHSFKGHSDTEVILEGVSRWGIRRLIERLNGIFAIALWDRRKLRLYLIRDRLGVKPLFWGRVLGGIAFASELKSIRSIPGAKFEIDREALSNYSMLGYVPAPKSIYKGIYKLSPGTILEIDENSNELIEPYALLDDIVDKGRQNIFIGSEMDAVESFSEILGRVIKRQLCADVPVGAFLSGGVDSSAIVAAIQNNSQGNLKTFTIKFLESNYDESIYARKVAKSLGTNHEEYLVSSHDALAVIPMLPDLCDEPFGDASIIPTYLLCKGARTQVSVAMSGDGGDELFSGYRRYMLAPRIFRVSRAMPTALRVMLANRILSLSAEYLDMLLQRLPVNLSTSLSALKLKKGANILLANNIEEVFFRQIAAFISSPVIDSGINFSGFPFSVDRNPPISFADQMQLLDQSTYLPDNNLAKVDRASMGVSLEVRVPLLDNELIDFAWTLPEKFKRRGSSGKLVLKSFLTKFIDIDMINRPKMGFGLPVDIWLRGPLKEWANDLLNYERIKKEGFFDANLIRQYWIQHLSGQHNHAQALWNILIFQAWKERWH